MRVVPHSDLTSYYVDRHDRRAVDLRLADVPECIVLGRSAYNRAYPPLPEHRHFNVAELAFVETGLQPYEIGGKRLLLVGGEGAVIPPDTPHSSNGTPSYPGRRFWLQLRLPQAADPAWLGLSPNEAAPLVALLRSPSPICAKWPSDFPRRFDTLFGLFDRPATPVRAAMLRTALLSLLFDLLDATTVHVERGHQIRIAKTIAWIEAHLSEPLSVEQLAVKAGLSTSNFKQAFKTVAGITPHAYLLRKRIEQAQAMLARGNCTITDVSLACGFTSSQYFATVFKRIVGLPPSDILKKRTVPLRDGADGQ